ncbi:hypothetical protein KKF38_05020 [Patescibacteria group bacterium]|nr:hypothetical protein [Patescibacteria group bacterium]
MELNENFPVEPITRGADKGTGEWGELVDRTLKKIFRLAINVDKQEPKEDIYLK